MRKNAKLRRSLIVALVTAMLVSSAACGGSPSPAPADTNSAPSSSDAAPADTAPAENAEPVTIKFWDMVRGTNAYIEGAEKLSKSFNTVMPNVTVDYQSIPWDNRYETFSVAIASGDAPDVSTGGGFQQHQFAATGDILELDSIVDEWEAEGTLDDFLPGLLDFFKYEGHQVGIPFNNESRAIYYRKDVFEEKGIEVPEDYVTFDQLYDMAVRCTDAANGVYGMVFPAADSGANVLFLNWFVSNGGGVWKEDSRTPDWTNPKNLESLNFITSLKDAGVFPEGLAGYVEADAFKLFLSGNAMIMPGVSNFGATVMEQGPEMEGKIGILPPLKGPSADAPAEITAYNATMAYKQTEHPERGQSISEVVFGEQSGSVDRVWYRFHSAPHLPDE